MACSYMHRNILGEMPGMFTYTTFILDFLIFFLNTYSYVFIKKRRQRKVKKKKQSLANKLLKSSSKIKNKCVVFKNKDTDVLEGEYVCS